VQTSAFMDIGYQLDGDGIVTVSMHAPGRKSISLLTALALRWAARHFKEDDQAQVMILTGAPDPDSEPSGQAFSSGGYLVPGIYDDLPEEIRARIDPTGIAMKATVLEFCSGDKPVLAAINGLAIGGGITLPLAVADQALFEHAWARLPPRVLRAPSRRVLPGVLSYTRALHRAIFADSLSGSTTAPGP
jgi:enoyl-CoA hydratase/carnithine racemase